MSQAIRVLANPTSGLQRKRHVSARSAIHLQIIGSYIFRDLCPYATVYVHALSYPQVSLGFFHKAFVAVDG